MSGADNGRDDFWDLDKLVPKKKKYISPFASAVRAEEHNIGGTAENTPNERKLSFESYKSTAMTEDTSYVPEQVGLIKRVTIKRYADKYDFYGSFRKAALIYHDYRAEKCDFSQFYSYMPQYSQMNPSQKNYYFYWRSEFRRGRYIKSDYSYIYLYVYEILNLPDKIPPSEGIVMLCRLWREYRRVLPRIDAYFSVWIQDYCLVYNLPCPMEEIRDFIFDVIGASQFKEFYLSDMQSVGEYGTDALLAYLSDYDWHRGRYAVGDNAELYRKHMHAAMRIFLSSVDALGDLDVAYTSLLTREAFAHSLCTHAVKCRLSVEYVPLARNERLRSIVTEAVRYTENKLRALLGIKSRLAIKGFSDEYKRIIDSYFDSLFERERQKRAKECAPEYERLYEAPSTELSFTGADEIERVSWTNTLRLVDGIEEETEESVTPQPEKITGGDTPDYGLSSADIALLWKLYNGDANIDDSAMERINEAFADGFGDVILEFDGDSYKIIEDYKEEIGEWLLKLMK